jgi:hypothetical protein
MVATANSVEGLSGSLAEAYAAGGATAIEEALRAHAAATKQRFRAEFAQLLDELEAKTETGERP